MHKTNQELLQDVRETLFQNWLLEMMIKNTTPEDPIIAYCKKEVYKGKVKLKKIETELKVEMRPTWQEMRQRVKRHRLI